MYNLYSASVCNNWINEKCMVGCFQVLRNCFALRVFPEFSPERKEVNLIVSSRFLALFQHQVLIHNFSVAYIHLPFLLVISDTVAC